MEDLDFRGKRALVVGGSSGIGNGVARRFKRHGAETHIWGTRPSASSYDGEKGSNMEGLLYAQMDASDFDALRAYDPPFESLDVLVLCQGTVLYKRQEFEKEGWDRVMAVNMDSVMHVAMKFRAMLSASKGALITVSSVVGFRASRGNPAYSASKSGLVGLTKTLGEAWASDGIRVNGIAPGFVATKLTANTIENEKRAGRTLAAIPAGRFGTPDDMAGVALFLASPLASYVYGQTILVDGGMTLS